MQLPDFLMLSIAIITGLVGILFLLFPDRIRRLEAWLNAPWGNREVVAMRFGTGGEKALERVINREVLSRQIVWDGCSRQYPRLVGAALCLLAMWLGWQV